MMDFDRKQFVVDKVQQNGTLLQMLVQTQQLAIQLAATLDQEHGTALAQDMANQFQMMTGQQGSLPGSVERPPDLGGPKEESWVTSKARERVANSTNPEG